MRILLSFQQDQQPQPHAVPAYRFWSYYLKNGIIEAGMSWLEMPGADWAEGLLYPEESRELKNWSARIWDVTLRYIRANRRNFDLFLCYLYPKQIDETAILEIRKLGIPCVNFYCDHIRQFVRVPGEFKIFDWMWVPEYPALGLYRKAGIRYLNLPMPMWVDPKYRVGTFPERSGSISFTGSRDQLRENLLGEASYKGLNIEVRGAGWAEGHIVRESPAIPGLLQKLHNQFVFVRQHGLRTYTVKTICRSHREATFKVSPELIFPIPDFGQYVALTQNSAVALGINRVPTLKSFTRAYERYSRLRDIEAPMLGACYLTEYCEGLDHLYDPEKEILVYHNAEDLVSQAERLLKDPHLRRQLRAAGRLRALTAHSIPASLKILEAAVFK